MQVGEPWVQGLVEGEYADLSVEERLNSLVALVTVVNEGNAIRIALEVCEAVLPTYPVLHEVAFSIADSFLFFPPNLCSFLFLPGAA